MSKLTPCRTATRLWELLIETPLSSQLFHGGADPALLDKLPDARLARLGEENEANPGGGALLIAAEGIEDRLHIDLGIEPNRQVVTAQQVGDLGGQLGRLGEAQRRQQAE